MAVLGARGGMKSLLIVVTLLGTGFTGLAD
jgi:hypothetical protein